MNDRPNRFLATRMFAEMLLQTQREIKSTVNTEKTSWVPARPLPPTYLSRWKLAWDVFRGKADALYWIKQ